MAKAAVKARDEEAARPGPGGDLLPEPLGALAVRLLERAGAAGPRGLLHLAGSERRAEALAGLLRALDPAAGVLWLPEWTCLPFDSASPSREAMGRRAAVLRRLAKPADGLRIVLTTPDAALQRVPPRGVLRAAVFRLAAGEPFDAGALETFLARAGYLIDERIDEPGEAALRGRVVDVFPPARTRPVRVSHEGGRVTGLHGFDPVTQLTVDGDEPRALRIGPASELILPAGDEAPPREPGAEHRLPEHYGAMETLFDLLPDAAVTLEPRAQAKASAAFETIAEAHAARRDPRLKATGPAPLAPDRLYLTRAEWDAALGDRGAVSLREPDEDEAAPRALPRFALGRAPERAAAKALQGFAAAGRRIVLAAATKRDARALAELAERALGRVPEDAADWAAVRDAAPGTLLALRLDLEEGFEDEAGNLTVLAAADLLGSRAGLRVRRAGDPFGADLAFRVGDAVIHLDHGMAALRAVETLPGGEAGGGDALRLEHAGGASRLVPVAEVGRVWRYGSDPEAVTLDRLDGVAWAARRAEVEAEIGRTAERLVALARERETMEAPVLVPPRRGYERVAERFPHAPTPDQTSAIEAVLADLASGRPMDRLVCGDVGYGKTEIAVRAAAAAVLAGKQVAVVAPTTVLARQHAETFAKRFEGLGVTVGHLSRLVPPAEARRVREGIASGEVGIAVGTHALGGRGVSFEDLGLLVIDEEHRLGAAQKARLRELGRGTHALTLTATPIPRTLQGAMAGLEDLSILATPPGPRRPIRTILTAFDGASVREALLRERRRGGQSFVVCPRVEDIAPMAARLAELVPDLATRVVHGSLAPEEVDEAMVAFAGGEGDVLLATNIIESGLNVPRANTMLIWRPDRFGLAQLHQLRGRVGRGRARGVAYLLTDPEVPLQPASEKRLRTLEALDRLGAGFAIAARDLDQRGAGDLLGEAQSGHVKLIGTALYGHLLGHALRAARGEPSEDWTPELHLGLDASIPAEFVPEPEVRLDLHARLARPGPGEDAEALAGEIEDRFGPLPGPVRALVAEARLRGLCRGLGVARLDAGPQAIALTFRDAGAESPALAAAVERLGEALAWKDGRLIHARATTTPEERLKLALGLLRRLGEG